MDRNSSNDSRRTTDPLAEPESPLAPCEEDEGEMQVDVKEHMEAMKDQEQQQDQVEVEMEVEEAMSSSGHEVDRRLVAAQLGEEVGFHESGLSMLEKRKMELEREIRQSKSRKQLLKAAHIQLQARKKVLEYSRRRNVKLQKKLRETLRKSHTKLQRLLRRHDDADGGNDAEIDQTVDAAGDSSLMVSKTSNEEREIIVIDDDDDDDDDDECLFVGSSRDGDLSADSIDEELFATSADNPAEDESLFFYNLDCEIRPVYDASTDAADSLHLVSSINTKELLERVLQISTREASAIDKAMLHTKNLNEGESTVHPRRSLMWKTCLDFLHLHGVKSKDQHTQSVEQIRSNRMDPNAAMCPYELDGFCADKLCPYQHFNKDRVTVIPEVLPLPATRLIGLKRNASSMSSPSATIATAPAAATAATTTTVDTKNHVAKRRRTNDASEDPPPWQPGVALSTTAAAATTTTIVIDHDEQSATNDIHEGNGNEFVDEDDYIDLPRVPEGAETVPIELSLEESWNRRLQAQTEDDVSIIRKARGEDQDPHARGDSRGIVEKREAELHYSAPPPQSPRSNQTTTTELMLQICGIEISTTIESKQQLTLQVPVQLNARNALCLLKRCVDCVMICLHSGAFHIASTLITSISSYFLEQDETSAAMDTVLPIMHTVISSISSGGTWSHSKVPVPYQIFSCQTQLAILSHFLSSDTLASDEMDAAGNSRGDESTWIWLQRGCQMVEERQSDEDASVNAPVGENHKATFFERFVSEVNRLKIDTMGASNGSSDLDKARALCKSIGWAISINMMDSGAEDYGDASSSQDNNSEIHALCNFVDSNLDACMSFLSQRVNVETKAAHKDTAYLRLHSTVIMGILITRLQQRIAESLRLFPDPARQESMTAALQSLDSSITFATCSLMRLARAGNASDDVDAGDAMLDLLITPIYAACVSFSVYLRSYAAAHRRIENEILSGHARSACCSEFLWSQYCQLHMALLPPRTGDAHSEDTASESSWMPRLAAKVFEHAIFPCRISMQGDGQLSKYIWSDPANPTASASTNEIEASMSSMRRCIYYLPSTQNGCNTRTTAATGNRSRDNRSSVSIQLSGLRLTTSATSSTNDKVHTVVSTFPCSLLLCGESLKSLRLERCALQCLPNTFGECVPHLEVS